MYIDVITRGIMGYTLYIFMHYKSIYMHAGCKCHELALLVRTWPETTYAHVYTYTGVVVCLYYKSCV